MHLWCNVCISVKPLSFKNKTKTNSQNNNNKTNSSLECIPLLIQQPWSTKQLKFTRQVPVSPCEINTGNLSNQGSRVKAKFCVILTLYSLRNVVFLNQKSCIYNIGGKGVKRRDLGRDVLVVITKCYRRGTNIRVNQGCVSSKILGAIFTPKCDFFALSAFQ